MLPLGYYPPRPFHLLPKRWCLLLCVAAAVSSTLALLVDPFSDLAAIMAVLFATEAILLLFFKILDVQLRPRTKKLLWAMFAVLAVLNLKWTYNTGRWFGGSWEFGWPYPYMEISSFFPSSGFDTVPLFKSFVVNALLLFSVGLLSERIPVLRARRFRFSLATCVVAVLTVGVLMGLNIYCAGFELLGWREFGWPMAITFDRYAPNLFFYAPLAVVVDLLVAVGILLGIASGVEHRFRHSGAAGA